MLKSQTNEELLKQIAVDDIKAFEVLYHRFATRMLGYAITILKDKTACEDIVQNIFIDVWSKRKTNTIDNAEAYLFRAVKFQIFNYFRDSKFSSEDLTRLNLVAVSISASKQLEFDELEKAIHQSVSKLPTRCKEIFELSRFQHKSNQEIADALGISMQAVKNQVSKALSAIREQLKKDEHILLFLLLFGYQL
ncbi:MAG: RNA polymerase sigma-70 factor [Aquaticitalea sp.]